MTKTKNEQIQNLFDVNYRGLLAADVTTPVKKNGVCFDGIIDEEIFEQCEKKVVYLLKETSAITKIKIDNEVKYILPDELEDWDYRGWLQNQQAYGIEKAGDATSHKFYSDTYNKLCMWLDVFYDCLAGHDLQYREYRNTRYNEANFRNLLKRTAIVNLKKTWGGSKTEWKHLYSYLHQPNNSTPVEMLKKEIEIIKPDVVICGSNQVFDFAKEVFVGQVESLKLEDGDLLKYFKVGNMLFLDFYHPSCRGFTEKYYNYAKERFAAIKDIL